jgi:HK97 gp10 family phage protein
MKTFGDFASLAAHLAAVSVAQRKMETEALEKAAKVVKKRAKAKIGKYQDEAPPFAAWAELSENTLHGGYANGIRYPGKIELGYATEGDHRPLLRSGEMRDSIEHRVIGNEAHVGSNNDKAVWQELGTEHIPPRSFLGGAAAEETPKIVGIIGESAVLSLVGEGVFKRKMAIKE